MLLQIKFGQERKLKLQSPLGLTDYSHRPEKQAAEPESRPEVRPVPSPKPVAVHPRIKTYFADSVREAMQKASRDMGEDAVLIQSEPSGGHAEGRFRVTCGSMTPEPFETMLQDRLSTTRNVATITEPAVPTAADSACSPSETERELRTELVSLREEFAALRDFVFRNQLTATDSAPSVNPMAPLQAALVAQGIDAEVASQWLLEAQSAPEAVPGESPSEHLIDHLAKSIVVDDSLDRPVVLVGPSGSGKTTALLKLALTEGVRRGKTVRILTVGNDADSKISSIANLLEIPVMNIPAIEGLRTALEQASSGEILTLVDTTGLRAVPGSDRDEALVTALLDLPVAVHLTLPATWSGANLQRAINRFEMFSPSHLLFTMMDQTDTPALVLEQAWKTGKRISFTNFGPMGTGPISAGSVTALLSGCLNEGEAMDALPVGGSR